MKGNIDRIGRVQRFVNYRNKEIRNLSFDLFCEKFNVQKPYNYRMCFANPSAGFKSFAKYDKVQPMLDLVAWKLAGDWTLRHFLPVMGTSQVVDGKIVIEDMDKTTSCGYPWSLEFHKKSDFLDSAASAVLEDYWLRLPFDDAPVPIWTCSQKIEMRPLEKLLSNSIRTFTASPVEHSYATNRLCLDFNNRFYCSANKTWSFVGSSKFMGGWHQYIQRLSYGSYPAFSKVCANNAFELDESEYDSSLFVAALEGQRDIRWAMLRLEDQTADNKTRLWKLYDSIIHSVVVLENGELVQKHTGNPSGSANTIVDNTFILFRLFAYAFIALSLELGLECSYTYFIMNVEAALNGDDNTYTVSDECLWFNPENIRRVWGSIGVTTKTPSDKPRHVTACGFLSQNTVWNKDTSSWFPCPDTDKVLCSLRFGSAFRDVKWHLLRAHALRIDSFANVECRRILSGYINFLNVEYKDQLVGVCNGLNMVDIQNVWKTDMWLTALYSGCESSVGRSDLLKVQELLAVAA